MINLEPDSAAARWFVWCCDHLPGTVTKDYPDDEHPDRPREGVYRKGAHYVEHGTTLCHLVCATVWVPIFMTALVGGIAGLLLLLHLLVYQIAHERLGVAALFLPEMFLGGIAFLSVILTLAVFGLIHLAKRDTGFLKLIWAYIRAVKDRVCPVVRFAGEGE